MDSNEILNDLPVIIWKLKIVNGKPVTIYTNKAWNIYTSVTDIFDTNITHPDDFINWEKAMNSGFFKINRRLKNKSGNYKWFCTQATRKGEIWTGICTDINELIELRNNTILTEETRIDLEEKAEILSGNFIIAEEARIALEEIAKILSDNFIIAENKRIDLEQIAKILSDNFSIAEDKRINLAANAKIAENKRIHLKHDAKILSDNFIIAEDKRINLAENFIIAEDKRINLAENFIIAEDKRINLAEKAEVLADRALISEIKIKNLRKRNIWKNKSCIIL
jgi:hypothetical protein